MRSPWFRIVGPAALCLALLPAGAPADAPKAKVPKKEVSLDAQASRPASTPTIARRWDEAKVVPAARADDAEFLRRI